MDATHRNKIKFFYRVYARVVVQIRDHQCIAIIKPSTEQASSKTEREGRVEANRRAELTLLSLQKSREFIPERK